MSAMFNGCKYLISLPDISKWNTNNIIDMDYMFNGCKSLKMVGNTNFSDFKIDWDKKFSKKLKNNSLLIILCIKIK